MKRLRNLRRGVWAGIDSAPLQQDDAAGAAAAAEAPVAAAVAQQGTASAPAAPAQAAAASAADRTVAVAERASGEEQAAKAAAKTVRSFTGKHLFLSMTTKHAAYANVVPISRGRCCNTVLFKCCEAAHINPRFAAHGSRAGDRRSSKEGTHGEGGGGSHRSRKGCAQCWCRRGGASRGEPRPVRSGTEARARCSSRGHTAAECIHQLSRVHNPLHCLPLKLP